MKDNTNWKQYKRKSLSEMMPWTSATDMTEVSVSYPDSRAGSPKHGDMIARNPQNRHKDLWLVSADYLEENFETAMSDSEKTLDVVSIKDAATKINDIKVVGNGDMFQLLCKASSVSQKWMKSTKAMEVKGGCVVQVSTQQNNNVAEALTFVPGVYIGQDKNGGKRLVNA